ncbi:unnamed protein product [Clonostachys rosea f. rosea IK726]|uniref:Uncharacterized protein n=1 Tax=Clonostachys rosea f. rosea IK726 TaxID=1349383 RepID=A0ACA9UCK4_BIOOC|nr:unnamed protein product [Clonostachys rosea f. rosea IK726]
MTILVANPQLVVEKKYSQKVRMAIDNKVMIVEPDWLEDSIKNKSFSDPTQYLYDISPVQGSGSTSDNPLAEVLGPQSESLSAKGATGQSESESSKGATDQSEGAKVQSEGAKDQSEGATGQSESQSAKGASNVIDLTGLSDQSSESTSVRETSPLVNTGLSGRASKSPSVRETSPLVNTRLSGRVSKSPSVRETSPPAPKTGRLPIHENKTRPARESRGPPFGGLLDEVREPFNNIRGRAPPLDRIGYRGNPFFFSRVKEAVELARIRCMSISEREI